GPSGARFGFVALQSVLQLLHLVGEALRASRELTRVVVFLLIRRAAAIRQFSLAIGDLLRLVAQRLHRAFDGCALEHLGALLELFLEALLHRREIFERLLGLVAGQFLRGVLELLHLLHELGRERLTQHVLRLTKLSRETAVQRTGGFELLLEGRRLRLEILDSLGEGALLLGYGPRLFGRLVAHLVLLAPALRFGRRRALVALRVRALA